MKEKNETLQSSEDKEWQARRGRAADRLAKMPINELTKGALIRIETMLQALKEVQSW